MTAMEGGQQITLPPGVTIVPSRETTYVTPSGANEQGMQFSIRLARGATTSVFVPYSLLGQTEAIQQLIDERIAGITAITG